MTAPALTMSVAETAAAFGISERLVYKMIDAGDLPSIALGRRKVVPARAVELVVERALTGFDPSTLAASLTRSAVPA